MHMKTYVHYEQLWSRYITHFVRLLDLVLSIVRVPLLNPASSASCCSPLLPSLLHANRLDEDNASREDLDGVSSDLASMDLRCREFVAIVLESDMALHPWSLGR
jgi:hypothetical protein